MPKTKKRKNYGKIIIRLVLIIGIFYLVSTFYDQHKEMQYLLKYEAALEQELKEVEADVNSLKELIEYSNEEEYIEQIARQRLKMIKKNETLFIDLGKKNS